MKLNTHLWLDVWVTFSIIIPMVIVLSHNLPQISQIVIHLDRLTLVTPRHKVYRQTTVD